MLLDKAPYINKDNKFGFEWSNLHIDFKNQQSHNMYGLQTLSNGLTFLGFTTSGDEQIPAFGIIYYDGNNLRLYFPSYGNYVNLDFNCALGSEWDYDNEENVEKKYRKLGIWDEDNEYLFEYGEPRWDALYCAKYGLDSCGCDIDDDATWSAMKMDIEARIEVV